MEATTYAALGHPGVGFFTMLLIGFLAGYTAEKVTQSEHGVITNILVGIAGAFVGGRLAEVLQIPIFGFFRTLFAAAAGAVIILWIWRRIRA
jgi:uncharacterized membrane protein YeaQ/YmgE (transglycosylase-associated protein family)